MAISDSVVGGLVTAVGALGLAAANAVFNRGGKNQDESYKIRQDQRTDIAQLKTDVASLMNSQRTMQEELDEWKDKYYKLLEEYQNLRTEHDQLKKDHEKLRKVTNNLGGEQTS